MIRKLAIELLEDEYGISPHAWAVLHPELRRLGGNYDIISQVYTTDDHRIKLAVDWDGEEEEEEWE